MTRVLIAEDETIIRLDLKGLLESAGFEVCAEARDGEGISGEESGTGLSIVRALVRDELRGELELRNDRGLRAEVVFPP